MIFFFKQKTAYAMRISDWSSDVCSSDLLPPTPPRVVATLVRLIRCFQHRSFPTDSARQGYPSYADAGQSSAILAHQDPGLPQPRAQAWLCVQFRHVNRECCAEPLSISAGHDLPAAAHEQVEFLTARLGMEVKEVSRLEYSVH